MNWLKTPLTERLPIRFPIIQAPMAGGITTPELVAAVSNAGGLGSLAAGYLEPEEIRTTIAAIRAFSDNPFAVNLFAPTPIRANLEQIEFSQLALEPCRQELGLPTPPLPTSYRPDFKEQLAVILEAQVDVLSFTFGVPGNEDLQALQAAGIVTMGTATNLLEAIVLEESGIDMIIAQGAEAGGHRGTFVGQPEQSLIGTVALVPLLADHIRLPIIAAGGIMDGRGIAAAMILGAAGVQMGTAFLTCPESGAHPSYKRMVSAGTEIGTTLTRAFSGRLARTLKNRFSRELQPYEADLPGYPVQLALTHDIRQAAAQQDRAEFMPLWAGQGCSSCEAKPAKELLEEWLKKVKEIFDG